MAKLKVTKGTIESHTKRAKLSRRPVYLWDTQEQGFGCRIAPSGHVSWMVQVWWDGRGGKAKRYTYPAENLDDAKKQAPEHRAKLLKKVDLTKLRDDERKASREADRKRRETALEIVVADYFKCKPTEEERYWKELRQRFDNEIVPHFHKDTSIADISKTDVRRIIHRKQSEGHPVAARTLYEGLRPFFKWCVDEYDLASSPLESLAAPPVPKSRDRVLADDEIKSLWSATAKLPLYGPFYRLLLLTLQRREEVGAMQWAEIDEATWTIPGKRTKNGKTHIVHLSPQALAVLEKIERVEGCPYVFGVVGRRKQYKPISAYSDAKAALDELLEIVTDPKAEGYDADKLWRVHDLRRTGRTNLAKLRIPKEVASKILNHSPGGKDKLDEAYNRWDYLDERKRALEKWGNHVEALVSGKPNKGSILPFRKDARAYS